jgi:hypothetical protein
MGRLSGFALKYPGIAFFITTFLFLLLPLWIVLSNVRYMVRKSVWEIKEEYKTFIPAYRDFLNWFWR